MCIFIITTWVGKASDGYGAEGVGEWIAKQRDREIIRAWTGAHWGEIWMRYHRTTLGRAWGAIWTLDNWKKWEAQK